MNSIKIEENPSHGAQALPIASCYSDKFLTRSIALELCAYLIRRPTTEADLNEIQIILGNKWFNVKAYLRKYPEGYKNFPTVLIKSINLTLKSCLALKGLILDNMALILKNEDCIDEDDNILITHYVTVDVKENKYHQLINKNLSQFYLSDNPSTFSMIAISQWGLDALNRTINKVSFPSVKPFSDFPVIRKPTILTYSVDDVDSNFEELLALLKKQKK